MKIVSSCEKFHRDEEEEKKFSSFKRKTFDFKIRYKKTQIFHALVGLAGLTICSNRDVKSLNHNKKF